MIQGDKKRLGRAYRAVFDFMADEQWHLPHEIAYSTLTRIDTALRAVRAMRANKFTVQAEPVYNAQGKHEGIWRYRAINQTFSQAVPSEQVGSEEPQPQHRDNPESPGVQLDPLAYTACS